MSIIDTNTAYAFPVTPDTVTQFKYFIRRGMDHWFPENVYEYWKALNDTQGAGYESFCAKKVVPDMHKSLKAPLPAIPGAIPTQLPLLLPAPTPILEKKTRLPFVRPKPVTA